MNIALVAKNLGKFLLVMAAFMCVCGFVSLGFSRGDELSERWAFHALLLAAGAGGLLGALAVIGTRGCSPHLGRREAVFLVTMSWVLGAFFAAMPYFFWSHLGDPELIELSLASFTSCFFEAMSGLTTTGATVIEDVEAMPRGLLLWRAATQWIGGVGIVVLFVAVLPSLGVGGKRLFNAESTGPSPEGLRPHIRETARILWVVYLILSCIAFGLYWTLGMNMFDAVCHALTTVSTGGFSTHNASFGAFQSPALEWAAAGIMFACGVSFGLYIRVLRRNATAIFRDTEFQLYALMMVIGVVVVTGAILGRGTSMAMVGAPAIAPQDPAFFDTVRNAVFTVVSMQTTTGYCVADFDFWPSLAIAAIFLLGFIGGCAGSTAGGVKVIRALIGARVLMANAESEHRPSVVRPLRIGRNIVDAGTKIEVLSVLLLGLVLLLIGATTFYILEGGEADITTAVSASLASLCNIGPGLGKVGASETYAWVSAPGQWVLAALMLLGRLEFFTVIVLLTKRFWVTD